MRRLPKTNSRLPRSVPWGPVARLLGFATLLVAFAAPAAAQKSNTRTHDGFYLRAGLGGGGLVDAIDGPFWPDVSVSGGSVAFELAVGGTIAPGLVLGGMFAADWVQNPTIEVAGFSAEADTTVGVLGMLGPFIDWYTDPRAGFHLQACIAAARITISDDSGDRSDHQPLGGAILLGVGYDWFVGGEVALGGLLRVTGASLADDGITHNVGAISLLFTFTYH